MIKVTIDVVASNAIAEFESGDTIKQFTLHEEYLFNVHKDSSGMPELGAAYKVRKFIKSLNL